MSVVKHTVLRLPEHYNYDEKAALSESDLTVFPEALYFNGEKDKPCVWISRSTFLKTGYFVGIDWITADKVIFVEPKLNRETREIDITGMLFAALRHPDILPHTMGLFEIKWEEKPISIPHSFDMLTPMLVVQFLHILQDIVRKGLKNAYFKTEANLHAKVKGKILISQSIKKNVAHHKPLNQFCAFDEFGLNIPENRLLKKALQFVRIFLNNYPGLKIKEELNRLMNYISPAFAQVSEQISEEEIKQTKANPIYKEYHLALKLANLILRRYGYSLHNIGGDTNILIPPFWMDMSRLFELYVLGLLKDKFGKAIAYHFSSNHQELDYLLNSPQHKMVVDAKYKQKYIDSYKKDDIRQIAGYSRLKKVYTILNIPSDRLIDCLIIYPDQENGHHTLSDFAPMPMDEFVGFYKLGVKLPEKTASI